LYSTKEIAINRKTLLICLAPVLWAIAAGNLWRFYPPDPDCVVAVSIYTEILRETAVIGLDYSPLTTTLGNFAAKKASEDPFTAALIVRLLKDAGVSFSSVVAINASGSFPGFVLASLSACNAFGLKPYVIASVGSSSYGANVNGNTIADILVKDDVRKLDYTLLAITPGGSADRGIELDPEELERIAKMLEKRNIPFIRPINLADAIALRESLFSHCTLLINIGGSHASSGQDTGLALRSGIIKPDKKETYKEPGLIQAFLNSLRPVIQILNVRKLYAAYGLDFDQNGIILGNGEKLYRQREIPLLAALLPIPVILVLLGIFRYAGIDKRTSIRR
jgi:poly-gamma-glutamate system protein